MSNDSIIKKTNQWWKVLISFFGLLASSAFMLAGFINMEKESQFIVLVIIGIIIGIISSLLGSIAISCPNCKSMWVWYAISKKHPGNWLPWLLNLNKCPKCNYAEKR